MKTPRDDEAALVPPDPQRVVARALVLAAVTCRGALEGDAGIAFVDDDLGIRGSPLGVVDEEQWRYCLSIARERQQAANWLLGYDPVYSEVGCDT